LLCYENQTNVEYRNKLKNLKFSLINKYVCFVQIVNKEKRLGT